MAKAAKKAAFDLAIGTTVAFVKYSNPLPKGQKPLFKKGEEGEIVAQENISTDPKDPYQSYMVRNTKTGEQEELYFPDEIELVEADEEVEDEDDAEDETDAEDEAEEAPAPKAKAAAKKAAPAKTPAKIEAKAAPAKKAAKPAPAEVEGEDEEEQLVLTDAVSNLVEGGSAVEAARDLLQGVSKSYFSLGGVLAFIQSTGAHKDVKRSVLNEETGKKKQVAYDDFFEFCAEELGQDKAKVYQLIRIYRKLSAAGVDETRFAGVGWTYARAMSKVITSDNADKLLEKAHGMSRDQFEDYITETYAKDGSAPAQLKIKRQRFGFAVHGDQAKTVEKTVNMLSKQLGTDDLGAIFHHLCVAFLQEQSQTTLEQDVQFLSETHGVTLEVTGKVSKAKGGNAVAKAKATKAPAKAAPAKAATKAKAKA